MNEITGDNISIYLNVQRLIWVAEYCRYMACTFFLFSIFFISYILLEIL